MANATKNFNVSLEQLSNFAKLTNPGTAKLTVRSTGDYVNPRLEDKVDGYIKSVIINFEAYETRKLGAIQGAITADGLDTTANKGLLFTHELIITEDRSPEIPMTGEIVKVALQYATKDGNYALDVNGQKILNVKSMRIAESAATAKVDFLAQFKQQGAVNIAATETTATEMFA